MVLILICATGSTGTSRAATWKGFELSRLEVLQRLEQARAAL
jgi:hypothetical protein